MDISILSAQIAYLNCFPSLFPFPHEITFNCQFHVNKHKIENKHVSLAGVFFSLWRHYPDLGLGLGLFHHLYLSLTISVIVNSVLQSTKLKSTW